MTLPIFVPGSKPTTADEFLQVYGTWPWNFDWIKPHPGRKSLLPEVRNSMFFHWCPMCGRWGSVGKMVPMRIVHLSPWYCPTHAPTMLG